MASNDDDIPASPPTDTGATAELGPCTTCSMPTAKTCQKCCVARYCSTICYKEDWKTHKHICQTLAEMDDRPNQDFRRALHLPASGNLPTWVWIRVRKAVCSDGACEVVASSQDELKKIEVWKHLGPARPIRRNEMKARNLDNALEFYILQAACGRENKTAVNLTGGRLRFPFTDSVLVMKKEGIAEETIKYLDMNAGNFRDAVDYLTAWGVVLANDEKFIEIFVAKDDVVFSEPVSPISQLVGMPLKGRKYPPNPRGAQLSPVNQPATFLYKQFDPENPDTFAFAPMEWQDGVGNVVFARADGEDLDIKHVQALCDYSQHHISDPIQDALEASYEGPGEGVMEKRKVMAQHLTPKAFAEFWRSYTQVMAKKDPDWKDAKAPVLNA